MLNAPKVLYTNLGCRNDLSTSSFALRSAFNDPRKIQDLDFGASILKDTRDGRKGCKGISCDFALGLCDLRKESRLSDRRKSNEGYPCIATFAYIEPAPTTGTSTRSRLEQLGTKTCKFTEQRWLAKISREDLG